MRVCPICGHHDPWYWRGSGVNVSLEWCRFDLFQEDYSDLAEKLLEAKKENGTKNFVFDKHYCYHLTKGMNVERQSIIENDIAHKHWHIPIEASPNLRSSGYGRNPLHHGHKMKLSDRTIQYQTKLAEKLPQPKKEKICQE